ncbi:Epoxyqueuosine reductase, partial [Exaiptasia diaphana]
MDYHFVIKDKLKELFAWIHEEIGEVGGRMFVDSAPVMDKAWAKRSGLGWMGKNSNLIHPKHGSFFFIAELIIDLPLVPDGPIKDYCGTCTACLDHCPTDAIVEPYVVDGSKCISYLTIELKDEILPKEFSDKMDNWMFGCDCLAEAAYYIESDGEAAIIDPLRDIDVYLDLSKERNTSIKYVFETHFHADFVSGHSDLKDATGAEIVYGPGAKASYEITAADDNQVFSLGNIKIKVLHTPGHTLESACFLVLDEEGKEHSIFTGDTLFVGDVGRPDLAVSSTISSTDLASMLYSSITDKLKPLPEGTVMYPGHGPGSQCGKSLGPEIESTLGAQLNGVNSVIN